MIGAIAPQGVAVAHPSLPAQPTLGARRLAYEERVLGRQLLDAAEFGGDRPFLKVGEDTPWVTPSELADRALSAAGGLAALGVHRGDRVAILLPNCQEFVVAWFGLAMMGAIEVPLNTALKGALLIHTLTDSGATCLITDTNLFRNVEPVLGALPDLRAVVLVGEDVNVQASDVATVSWASIAESTQIAPVRLSPSDPIAVMYTSGTTGPAKGVVCPHGYFSCWADDTGRAIGFESTDVLYTPLPLFHLTGQCVNVQMALVHGGRIVLDQRFSPRGFWTRMRGLDATVVWSFGSMTPLLFKQPPHEDDRGHDVRILWSIPWPTGYGREFEERFDLRIMCGYGSTEQGLTIVQPLDAVRSDTIGVASPHYEVAVVDERGIPVPDGEVGEIVTRPREPSSMMSGYLGRAEDTVTALRDLWFHTGDRGVRDVDGYFRFVDRKKDAIRRRGENISAWEIESVIATHPAIEEVAAIGVPSEFGEDEVKVVATLEAPLKERELFDFCRDQLPYYMVPRYIEFVAELPKTPSLRVQKFRLREDGVTAATWDCEQEGIRIRRPG